MISRATRAGFRKNDSETFALENLSDDIEAFTAILLAVLPQLLVKTRHVAELWENMMSIWGIIFYSTYHLQFIYASQSESLDTTTACVLSSSPSGARFQLDLKALKLITQEILLMPVAHVIEIQPSISGVGQKVKRTVKPAIDHSKYLRQRRLFSNSMGADTLRPELQQALPYDINSTFDSSLRKSSNHDIDHHDFSQNGNCLTQILTFSY